MAGEAFGFASGGAALHVHDLSVAERDHLEALLAAAVRAEPSRGPDDDVGSDLFELRLHFDPPLSPFLYLKSQDLTGLVRTASGGRAFPPEVTVRDAAPLRVLREQRRERFWITFVERLGRRAKLVDHRLSMARRYPRLIGRSTVEILFFEGCPNYERTRGLVEQASVAAGVELELRLVEVTSPAAAERLRFLGSPSVRING